MKKHIEMSFDDFKNLVDKSNSIKELIKISGISKNKVYHLIDKYNLRPVPKCLYCNKVIEEASVSGSTKRYCSEKCKHKYRTSIKTCVYCGKEFIATKNKIYCSKVCKSKGLKPFEKKCEWCGITYKAHNLSKYCSERCKRNSNDINLNKILRLCEHCGEPYLGNCCVKDECLLAEALSAIKED